MLPRFRFRKRWPAAPSLHTNTETSHAEYTRAWAEYVEWSGVDQDKLSAVTVGPPGLSGTR